MRIDAHQHFWRYDPAEYGWITDALAPLKHDFLPKHLQPLLNRTGVDGTIAVQARQSLAETDWLLQLADQHSLIKGVVGWIELQGPQAREQLAHYAQHPKFKGLRHLVQDEPDDRFMLRPAFLAGLRLLHEFDLTYDLLLFPQHLPVAVEVVQQLPEQRFVLDHLAKPAIKTQTFAPWEAGIRTLAQFPQVWCKLSGMVTEAVWNEWKQDDFRRYLHVVFDCFGSERLLWGSDWPVCTPSASYAEVMLIVLDFVRQFPLAVQNRIFGETAMDVYRLT